MPTIDTADILRGLDELALAMATRVADDFVEEVQGNASRRTGFLAESVKAEPPVVTSTEIRIHIEVGADYGIYQEEGTGIFGPEGRPITSTRPGGVLRFDWPAAGGIVFARSVIGSEPTRFWSKAVDSFPQIVNRVNAGG